jgi:hypothetical protein
VRASVPCVGSDQHYSCPACCQCPACTSEAAPSPSWRKLEIHAPKLDPSSHFRLRRHSVVQLSFLHPYRPLQYEVASFTCQEQWLHMVYVEREMLAVRPHIQRLFDASSHSHVRTLKSHMEPNRGIALSILTSIGSDMHECRLACRPMYMHHTHWSAGIQRMLDLVSPNTRADFAANHH